MKRRLPDAIGLTTPDCHPERRPPDAIGLTTPDCHPERRPPDVIGRAESKEPVCGLPRFGLRRLRGIEFGDFDRPSLGMTVDG